MKNYCKKALTILVSCLIVGCSSNTIKEVTPEDKVYYTIHNKKHIAMLVNKEFVGFNITQVEEYLNNKAVQNSYKFLYLEHGQPKCTVVFVEGVRRKVVGQQECVISW